MNNLNFKGRKNGPGPGSYDHPSLFQTIDEEKTKKNQLQSLNLTETRNPESKGPSKFRELSHPTFRNYIPGPGTYNIA